MTDPIKKLRKILERGVIARRSKTTPGSMDLFMGGRLIGTSGSKFYRSDKWAMNAVASTVLDILDGKEEVKG